MVRRVERREYSGLCRHAPHALNRKTTAKMSWNMATWGRFWRRNSGFDGGGAPDCTETLVQEAAQHDLVCIAPVTLRAGLRAPGPGC